MQQGNGCANSKLREKMLHIPSLRIHVDVECGGAVAALSNEDASVFILHQWNMSKLESENQVWASNDGSFILPEQSFVMNSDLFHGPNVRIGICMDGQQVTGMQETMVTDRLQTQTVIYGNTSVSIADLMFHNGQPIKTAVRMNASSSDENGYVFRLRVQPINIDEDLHYSKANTSFLRQIAKQHVPMTTISKALHHCSAVRRNALVAHMKSRGVPEIDAKTFYMQVPMGSIFDIHMDSSPGNPQDKATVDIPQWHALNEKSSILLAESHFPKVTESAMKWIAWECAANHIDPTSNADVSAHIDKLTRSAVGLQHMAASFKQSVMKANEDGFQYTSDSQIKGFRVLNTMHGIKLQAAFSNTGEKQNGHGLDALTCDNQMQRVCALYKSRSRATADADREQLDSMRSSISSADHSAALQTIDEAYARQISNANIAASMHPFMADCEDACASLVAVMQAPTHVDEARIPVIVNEVVGSGLYPPCCQQMAGSVTKLLLAVRAHNLMGSVERVLCFAHGANLAEMKLARATPPVVSTLIDNYNTLCDDLNKQKIGGHACGFSVVRADSHTQIHPLFKQTVVTGVTPHEGTNPVTVLPHDAMCQFDTHTTSPELEKKFLTINGNMPVTMAKSIVSELSSHSAHNILNCRANAVTYTTEDSPFYHTLISSNGGYFYTEQDGLLRPTCRISLLDKAPTNSVLIEGQLLDSVMIDNVRYSEEHLIDMTVRASTCLAPTYQRILQRQRVAGLRMASLRDSMPPDHHADMTRVICRTPILQVAGIKTDACHAAEQLERTKAVRAIHSSAKVSSCNSHTFDIYFPQV